MIRLLDSNIIINKTKIMQKHQRLEQILIKQMSVDWIISVYDFPELHNLEESSRST